MCLHVLFFCFCFFPEELSVWGMVGLENCVYWSVFRQLDTNQSYLERRISSEETPLSDGLQGSLSSILLIDDYSEIAQFTRGSTSRELVVLGAIQKQAEQAIGSVFMFLT